MYLAKCKHYEIHLSLCHCIASSLLPHLQVKISSHSRLNRGQRNVTIHVSSHWWSVCTVAAGFPNPIGVWPYTQRWDRQQEYQTALLGGGIHDWALACTYLPREEVCQPIPGVRRFCQETYSEDCTKEGSVCCLYDAKRLASKVTTLWRYTNLFIIIIIVVIYVLHHWCWTYRDSVAVADNLGCAWRSFVFLSWNAFWNFSLRAVCLFCFYVSAPILWLGCQRHYVFDLFAHLCVCMTGRGIFPLACCRHLVFTMRRYASVVYAIALSMSVIRRSSIETADWIELVFWHGSFLQSVLHCCAVFLKIWVPPKIRVLPSGTLFQSLELGNFATASQLRCQPLSFLVMPIWQLTSCGCLLQVHQL